MWTNLHVDKQYQAVRAIPPKNNTFQRNAAAPSQATVNSDTRNYSVNSKSRFLALPCRLIELSLEGKQRNFIVLTAKSLKGSMLTNMLNSLFKTTISSCALVYTALLTAFPASADVYRWVDEAGIVHYSDRKPSGTDSTLVKVEQRSRNAGNKADNVSQRLEALEEQQEIDKVKALQEKEEAVAEKALAEYCHKLKSDIDTLTNNPRIRTTGEDGEKRFMTPEEIVKKRNADQQTYNDKCNQ